MVADIRKGWARALVLAGGAPRHRDRPADATPHTLMHTAITWVMQRGADPWDPAGYFSSSLETIERVYGHHHPDHRKSSIEALNRR